MIGYVVQISPIYKFEKDRNSHRRHYYPSMRIFRDDCSFLNNYKFNKILPADLPLQFEASNNAVLALYEAFERFVGCNKGHTNIIESVKRC